MPGGLLHNQRRQCRIVPGAAVLLLTLAGCQTMPVPSVRLPPTKSWPPQTSPTPATPALDAPSTATSPSADSETQVAQAAPEAAVPWPSDTESAEPSAQPPPSPVTAQPPVQAAAMDIAQPQPPQSFQLKAESTRSAQSPQIAPRGTGSEQHPIAPTAAQCGAMETTSCDWPLSGICGADPCPPLIVLPKCKGKWRCYLGPLFCSEQSPELAQMAAAEAKLQIPHSLFHPVPTAPVFSSRYDYEPPQLMMAPEKPPALLAPHRTPRSLPPMSEMGPLAPLPSAAKDKAQDPDAILVPTPPAPQPRLLPERKQADSFSPSAERLQSVLKRH